MGRVWIVCFAGVEWNEIKAVFASKDEADRFADAAEEKRLKSRNVIERMSNYTVQEWPVTGARS